MPVALLILDSQAEPIILTAPSDAHLLDLLQERGFGPSFTSCEEAALWLWNQPYPSGWYRSSEEAKARILQDRTVNGMRAEELAGIRMVLAMSRARFADELGFSGTANTRHKQIWEMEQARKPILPERARAARALIALTRLANVAQAG